MLDTVITTKYDGIKRTIAKVVITPTFFKTFSLVDLFFFSKYDKDDAAERMEIDFLIAKSRITSRHNISIIEVKSTTRYTITSLQKCIAKYGQYIATPYVLHSGDLSERKGIVYLPLYMTPLL